MAETVLLVQFSVHPGHAPAFEAALQRNAAASLRDEPGCRQFDVCRDPQDPCRFLLFERYDDDQALAAHRRSAHYLAMQAQTQAWVASVVLTPWQRDT